MIAQLTFNLPEEDDEFRTAVNGNRYFSILFDFDQYLRSEIKHHGRGEFEEVRDRLNEMLREEGIEF